MRTRRRLRVLVAAALALAPPLTGVAAAHDNGGSQARLRVSLHPPRPGRSTVIHFAFLISEPGDALPPALRELTVGLPAGMGIDMSGLPSCSRRALRRHGAKACPRGSRVGAGSVLVKVPLGEVTRLERAKLTVYKGPAAPPRRARASRGPHSGGSARASRAHASSRGRQTLIFEAVGRVPIATRLIFAATIHRSPKGATIAASIPLIPTLPSQPDAAILKMTSTIGAIDRRAARARHHHPPRGVTIPKRCSSGGLPFRATFAFNDGSASTAHTSARCGSA